MKANGINLPTAKIETVKTESAPVEKRERSKSAPPFVRASTPKEERRPIGSGSGKKAELQARLMDPAKSNLLANHEELLRLEQQATKLESLNDPPPWAVRIRDEIRERYAELSEARFELARLDPRDTVVARARPRTLSPGTRLYTCASEAAIRSILQHGILLDPPGNNFGDPEMGTGLYVDTTGGSYRDGVKKVLVLEVVEDLEGVSTEPLEEYRRKGRIDRSEIDRGYRALQNAHPFLQHEGLPPLDTEIVFRRTDQKLRVVGVVEDPGWDVSVPTDPEITPLDDYLAQNDLQLHDSWRTRLFKVARGREAELVCHAEVGATALANLLLPQALVPRAEHAIRDGRAGTSQPFVSHRPLMEHDARGFATRDFDPGQLTQKQVDQMYAHMLVDWVLSNHDDHPLQFGIANNGDLIAFDKAQAYKFFKGLRTASPLAERNIGPETGDVHSPFDVQKDPAVSAYARLQGAIAEGRIAPNLTSEIIQETVFRMATLSLEDVQRCLGAYARAAFPGREGDFFRDVLDRAHAVITQLTD